MSLIEKSIEINVPVRTAYNQWTQFEEFPKFMEGVKHVKQLETGGIEAVSRRYRRRGARDCRAERSRGCHRPASRQEVSN